MITLTRPFRILAHRGACGYAPENTMASFSLATTMQPEAIETDLRLTKDGHIVLFHDPTVERTTDGTGEIAQLTLEELRRLTCKGERADQFPPQRIPTLEEFLDEFLGKFPLCLEVKAMGVIEPLLETLKARGERISSKWVELTSFADNCAAAVRDSLPHLHTGRLVKTFDKAMIDHVAAEGFEQICPSAKQTTTEAVEYAKSLGLGVRTWGIHNRDDLLHVIDSGADGTTLNWPDWVQRPTRNVTAVQR